MTTPASRRFRILSGAALLFLLTLGLVGLNRPPWGDERHVLETVRSFGKEPSIDLLKDYNEVMPPLTFLLYAGWGTVFGFETPVLRFCSLVLSAGTLMLFAALLSWKVPDQRAAAVGFATFALNPYTVGLSLFVFTDLLMILCLLAFVSAVQSENTILILIASTAGLLTRQYFVFVLLAGLVFYAIVWMKSRSAHAANSIAMLLVSTVPLLLLMIVWGGIAPPAGIALWIPPSPSLFHPESITLYVVLAFVFVAPVCVLRGKLFRFSRGVHAGLLLLSLSYWLIPVRASDVTVTQTGLKTVGLFHRTLVAAFHSEAIVHGLLFVCFFLGLHVITFLVRSVVMRWRSGVTDLQLFLDLTVLLFFVVMPFSYQVWEKYFLALVPVIGLRLLIQSQHNPEPLDA